MKTIRHSFRVWFAVVLFISGGALSLRAIWAEAIDPTSGEGGSKLDTCWAALGQCNQNCEKYRHFAGAIQARQQCYNNCVEAFYRCDPPTNPTVTGASHPITTQGPPNSFGPHPSPNPAPILHGPNRDPTPSPTPRRNPIKGPPHRLGPSPSPTAGPILLAKPTSPTPSPIPRTKKHSGHDHH
jgi:hypothetical protein